ncbi:MAG TPA: type I-E CRISPR-associated protein Cas6/Cse3/CasE [Blastocatellia bacterium]|jgi:CRISPR system Cascade subunit CasE|nr:type I-E CRISPR-associated protein Cas6/Cse3/CasE [Blastocatellia bacterium]
METKLFLSKLILNQRSYEARRDLADCHDLHRTIMSAFPQADGAAARDEFGVLFRVDAGRNGKIVLLVQSQAEPDWSRLPGGFLLETEGNPACKPVLSHYAGLETGQRLLFRLLANPTKRVSAKNNEEDARWHGKRIELRREEDQIAWLRRRGEAAGFRLLAARVNRDIPNVQTAPRPKTSGWREKSRLSFGSALFNGELEITDAERFRQALSDGVGSGKAYGFGLLSVAPIGAGRGAE